MIKTMRTVLCVAMVGLLASGAQAQQKTVTFAHQDMLVPLRLVMESGEVEKATRRAGAISRQAVLSLRP